jgi:3'(2'), 5'-bisphosphate nucleotidase/myo-inositol-1(or 4)-monophosphatase
MHLKPTDLNLLRERAERVAKEAGALIMRYAGAVPEIKHKAGAVSLAAQVVTEVDHKCDALIREHLMDTVDRFDLALLTEETEDDGSRLKKDYFWCVDPLDGTLAFTRSVHGYSVAISLITKQGEPVIGVVYDPLKDDLYSAVKGQGAKHNGQRWRPLDESKVAVEEAVEFIVQLDCSFIESARFSDIWARVEQWAVDQGYSGARYLSDAGGVMSAIAALREPPACYFKPPKDQSGGGSVWDFAATACIFAEVGAYAMDYSGKSFHFNPKGDTYMNHCGVMFSTNDFSASMQAAGIMLG